MVIIICIGKYDGSWPDLQGPGYEKQQLIKVFGKYKYDIICNKHDYVSSGDIDTILESAKNRFLSSSDKYQSIMFVHSGHGIESALILSDGQTILRSKIECYFNGRNIKNKLSSYKIFFFDSCRGPKNSYAIPINHNGARGKGNRNNENASELFGNKYAHPEENRCVMYSNAKT